MIPLRQLLPVLGEGGKAPECERLGGVMIEKLCYHSAEAVAGTLFFCLVGKTSDGHSYAPAAYRQGCRFFVVEQDVVLPGDALQIKVRSARAALADCAAVFYGHPERELRLIGLTGTKGKTTTAVLIRSLLCAAGIPAGYIGTNGVDYANKHFDTLNSTPESVDIYRYLRQMCHAGMQACALEVSSQALWMGRVRGLSFDTVIFTNLSRDHIGGVEHPDLEHYKRCKRRLLTDYPADAVLVNRDDAAVDFMLAEGLCKEGASLMDFALAAPSALYTASAITPARQDGRVGVSFVCCRAGKALGGDWFLPLPGDFNVQNALAALCVVCERFGISFEAARTALATATVAGRFETVTHPALPDVTFVIDYAHNGVSLAAILDALRIYRPRRLIALFGSVGGRTKERRRDLAEAAAHRCELCILTSDNPAGEDPTLILRDIDAAFPAGACKRLLIPDRAEAIREAAAMAEAGDIILLSGKGHESYQLVGTRKLPFCERELLWNALEERMGAKV